LESGLLQGAPFILCFSGLLLFLLALLNGFAIPSLRSPRLGLSCTFDWRAIGHVPHRSRPDVGSHIAFARMEWPAGVGSCRCARSHLPIAGGGITTSPARQRAVTALMGAGSLALIVVVVAILGMMTLHS
jgi:hypothetical protein